MDADDRPLYSALKVAEIVGISYRQLDYWVRVELLDPCRNANGSGTRRLFSENDLADARLAALLMSTRDDTLWARDIVAKTRLLDTWAGRTLVIHPDGRVEIDGAVDTVAVVVNLGALVPESVVAA